MQYLAVRRKQTELDKVIEALLFSFVLYVLTLPLFGYTLPVSWRETSLNVFQVSLRWAQLAVLAALSLALGVLYAASINRDWLLHLFRRARITERKTRSSIWNDVFQQLGGWVQVGLAGDVIVRGWLTYYSDEAEESSLFLENAAWIDQDGKVSSIEGPGILITKEVGIRYVIFLGGGYE